MRVDPIVQKDLTGVSRIRIAVEAVETCERIMKPGLRAMVNSGPMRLGGSTLFNLKANVVSTGQIYSVIRPPIIDQSPLKTYAQP